LLSPDGREELAHRSSELPSIVLSARTLSDLEMLATGGYSPLRTFMGQADFESVNEQGRLADGTLFPAPIVCAVPPSSDLRTGQEIALRNTKNNLIAWMRIDELFPLGPEM